MYIFIFIFLFVLNVTLSFTFSEEIRKDFLKEINTQLDIKDGGISKPLTNIPGNAISGRNIVAGRKGNCLACHMVPIPEEKFHGNFGPNLEGVASRRSEEEIRLQLVDPRYFNTDSIMPSYFKTKDLKRVDPVYSGKPILSKQDIEDVISYLITLKEP